MDMHCWAASAAKIGTGASRAAIAVGALAVWMLGACTSGVGGPDAPVALFESSATSGEPPLEVDFTDSSTGEVATWLWNFGDGQGSVTQNPTHVYTEPGEYTVSLTVAGLKGADSEVKTGLVRVGTGQSTGAPQAEFSANNTSGTPPLETTFRDLSQGDVTGWTWTFGDGQTSSQQNPVHSYTAAGVYGVTLTARGPGGSDAVTKNGFVRVGELVADFSAQNSVGDAPLMVTFADLSTGAVTSRLWSFGDGQTSTLEKPTHTYSTPGNYSVGLTVTGPDGTDSTSKGGLVRVLDADRQGLWSSSRELEALPASGPAWSRVLSEANAAAGTPDLSNQDDDTDVRVLAKALVHARTGDEKYRSEVIAACRAAIGTELGGRTLALGRNLVAYVIAADLVGLPPADDAAFRTWLQACLDNTYDGRTLATTHEERPNNWGTHAGASRVAAALYLGDTAEVERCAQVFHGWLGDRSAYAGFEYGDLSWQADPSSPVGINPAGATRDGHSIDGVLPDDQRRSGGFTWPPTKENYVWEALQGALAQAVILHRAGYDVWSWEDQALLRAVKWLHEQCGFPATGDDTWQPHLINAFYGEDFPAPTPSSPGKNVGWTDWSHAP